MNKVLKHVKRSYRCVFINSSVKFPQRFVCIQSSVQQTLEQTSLQKCDSSNHRNKFLTSVKNDVFGAVLAGQSVEEIMDSLNGLDPDKISVDHIADAVERIVHVHYDKLIQQTQWLHFNHYIAYVQLYLSGSLESSMQSFHLHPFYPRLYNLLLTRYHDISYNRLGTLYLNLSNLGISLHDPLMAGLLIKIKSVFEFIPLDQLVDFSLISRSRLNGSSSFHRKTFSVLKDIMHRSNVSEDQLVQASTVMINLKTFASPSLLLDFSRWVLSELKCKKPLKNLDNLVKLFRFLGNIDMDFPGSRTAIFEILNILKEDLHNHVTELEAYQIAEICRSYKHTRFPHGSLNKKIEERAEELFRNDTLRFIDVVNLMHCLTVDSSPSLTTTCENLLYSKLTDPLLKVDVILLSNVAECLSVLYKVNQDLLALIHQLIAQQATNIILYISRFIKITNFLYHHPFKNSHDQQVFCSAVINKLEEKCSESLFKSSLYNNFLIKQNSHHFFPHHLYLKFFSSLPRMPSSELCRLLFTLSKNLHFVEPQQKSRYMQVLGLVQQEMLNRANNLQTPEELFPFLLCTNIPSNIFQFSVFAQRVENALMGLSELHTLEQANTFSKVMDANRFYLPTVFDHFFQFFGREQPSTFDFHIEQLFTSAAFIGYVFKHYDSLGSSISTIYHGHISNKEFFSALQFLWNLALTQCFPEHLFTHLFSVSTLHSIDMYLEEYPNNREKVESLLLKLNCSVVLERPHFNVPWFHSTTDSEYHVHLAKEKKLIEETQMFEDVAAKLEELLGHERLVRKHSITSYFHPFDFEILMDKNNRFIDPTTSPLHLPTDFKRLAILLYSRNAYCSNSKVLRGYQKLKERHLRILNYKVVQIPFYHWYSMGMASDSSKIAYLKSKFFCH